MESIKVYQDSITASCKVQQNWDENLMFNVILPREAETRSCNIMAFLGGGRFTSTQPDKEPCGLGHFAS
jgi:hypothetical protein